MITGKRLSWFIKNTSFGSKVYIWNKWRYVYFQEIIMKICRNFYYVRLAATVKVFTKNQKQLPSNKENVFMNLRPSFTRKESQSTCLIKYDLKA